MHGVDVRVGKQRQHPEFLRRANRSSEVAHRLGVKNIPAKGCTHLQVIADQVQHQVAFKAVAAQAVQDSLGKPRALSGVLTLGVAFASVVQQRSKVKQPGVLQLALQRGKATRRFG